MANKIDWSITGGNNFRLLLKIPLEIYSAGGLIYLPFICIIFCKQVEFCNDNIAFFNSNKKTSLE